MNTWQEGRPGGGGNPYGGNGGGAAAEPPLPAGLNPRGPGAPAPRQPGPSRLGGVPPQSAPGRPLPG
ncbi:LytR family transcriptional regulator, partial [Kitasatospora sp. NPDC059648]